jgi:hypothetical protein
VTIRAGVNQQHKSWEIDQHSSLKSAKETAPWLLEMCMETVEGHHKSRNMKHILDQYMLTIEGEDGGAMAQDRNKGVIAHADLQFGGGFVGYED